MTHRNKKRERALDTVLPHFFTGEYPNSAGGAAEYDYHR